MITPTITPEMIEQARQHHARGCALQAQRGIHLAIDEFAKAIELNPNDIDSRFRLGDLCSRVGELDRAFVLWRECMQLAPDWPLPHQLLIQNLNYDPKALAREIFDEHVAFAQKFLEPLTGATSIDYPNSRDPDRRLRVGYVSPDFRNHPVSAFIKPILQSHDRNRIEAICFSDAPKPDKYSEELQSLAQGWHATFGRSDEEVAQLVRSQRIDILIDLVGHLQYNRLPVFARRPAPVQVSYLGYCNTTGLSAMDWILLDDITDPPDRSQLYTEKIIRLPHGFSCYASKPLAAEPNDLPAIRNGYITFACFHRPKKLNDVALDLLARVLREVSNSKILFWRDMLFGRTVDLLETRMRQRGIADDRYIIRNDQPPTQTHLGMYHSVDISLDVQPWSGHTTACESLWMGVPYVTMLGEKHAGRMAASAVTHAGAGEFVGRDADEYVKIVKALASDLPRLAELRRTLRPRMAASDLCNGAKFTASFEDALRAAWREWCASAPSPSGRGLG